MRAENSPRRTQRTIASENVEAICVVAGCGFAIRISEGYKCAIQGDGRVIRTIGAVGCDKANINGVPGTLYGGNLRFVPKDFAR